MKQKITIYQCECCKLWMLRIGNKNIKNRYLSVATFSTQEKAKEFVNTNHI
jgi:hypothetical protein